MDNKYRLHETKGYRVRGETVDIPPPAKAYKEALCRIRIPGAFPDITEYGKDNPGKQRDKTKQNNLLP